MQILYGGAFNPPTIAHYEIMRYLLQTFPDCNLIILPTNDFYKKHNLVSFYHRVKMLEILCQELHNPRVTISDYELKLDKYYGTYYTLQHFNHPYFVIGADALNDIHKWIKFPEVVIENKFIVFPRGYKTVDDIINENIILTKYKNNFIILDQFEKINVSSSMFREEYNPQYVHQLILKYIQEHKLYEVI